MFMRAIGDFLYHRTKIIDEWSPSEKKALVTWVVAGVGLLALFYGLFALPIISGLTETILCSAVIVPGELSLCALGLGYLQHLAFYAVEGLLTYIFDPESLKEFGQSLFMQSMGYILALTSGTFGRCIGVLVNSLAPILGVIAGISWLAPVLAWAGVAFCTLGPIYLAYQINQQAKSRFDLKFSASAIAMMAYNGFVGACFPRTRLMRRSLGFFWDKLSRLTGAEKYIPARGIPQFDKIYGHFARGAVPVGALTSLGENLFFSKRQQQPTVNQQRVPRSNVKKS